MLCQSLASEKHNVHDNLCLKGPPVISVYKESLLNTLLYCSSAFNYKVNREILLRIIPNLSLICTALHQKLISACWVICCCTFYINACWVICCCTFYISACWVISCCTFYISACWVICCCTFYYLWWLSFLVRFSSICLSYVNADIEENEFDLVL